MAVESSKSDNELPISKTMQRVSRVIDSVRSYTVNDNKHRH